MGIAGTGIGDRQGGKRTARVVCSRRSVAQMLTRLDSYPFACKWSYRALVHIEICPSLGNVNVKCKVLLHVANPCRAVLLQSVPDFAA